MKILLKQAYSGQQTEVTEYLDESGPSELTTESELDAFERVVSDVRLQFSNLDGTMRDILGSLRGGDRWIVEVWDDLNIIRFRGIVDNPSVRFLLAQEVVTLNAFSIERWLWDTLADVRMRATAAMAVDELAFADALNSLLSAYGITDGEMIAPGLLAPAFSSRMVRGGTSQPAPIGNIGRVSDVNRSMSVADFMRESSKYYNCEFYVDPVTRRVVMAPRNRVNTNAESITIDDYLLDDPEPEVQPVGQQLYDYVLIPFTIRPIPVEYAYGEPFIGQYGYRWMRVVVTQQLPFPSQEYSPTTFFVKCPGDSVAPPQVYYRIPTLRVGPGNPQALRLTVWATEINDPGGPALRRYVSQGSAEFLWTGYDNNGDNAVYTGSEIAESQAWIRFNESTGTWEQPILSYGNTTAPTGKTFDATPRIQFINIADPAQLNPYDPAAVFALFRHDMTDEQSREQWREFFITKRRTICGVHTVIPTVGQEIRSSKLAGLAGVGSNRFLVKKSRTNLAKEQTIVEAIPL